ncbi:MAG: site-specific integrase, partial [Pseudomonadota bacterium]
MADSSGWIGAFLEALAAERGAAANTLAAYRRDLEDFAAFCACSGAALPTAGRAEIEAYLADLEAAGRARTTRARRLSALRQLYRFALTEGWRADDPAARLQGPGRPARLPKALDESAVDRLLDTAAARVAAAEARAAKAPPTRRAAPGMLAPKHANAIRLVCLLELLYATGLRVTELVSLPLAAARGRPRLLMLRGKGGRERLVPLSEPAQDALARWLAARATRSAATSPWLFPSTGRTGHLSRLRVWQE